MNIEDLKKEYATQDNRFTAYPFYVQVQELTCIGVIADGYSACCPTGDGKTVTEYKHHLLEGSYDSEQEVIDKLDDYFTGDSKEKFEGECGKIEAIEVGYIWYPVEIFLTIKGAEEYMQLNRHNHHELRTYIKWFESRNFEMRKLLKEIGFKVD